jgi:hypothetical protein
VVGLIVIAKPVRRDAMTWISIRETLKKKLEASQQMGRPRRVREQVCKKA